MAANRDRDCAVRCRGVTKTYGTGATQVHALRGVDLTVYRGELLMLVGPSGCGKTTLISIISAMLTPNDGQCEVLGQDLGNMNPVEKERFRRDAIGFVFQSFNLLPALTALENIMVPLLISGVSRQSATARANTILDDVGLSARADALPAQLSGGQQQRVAIARALIHDPQLIVCDEPTSSLDHHTGQEMMAVLRRVAQRQDRALIIVTHDNRIFDFADRIVHMDDGRIIDSGDSPKGTAA